MQRKARRVRPLSLEFCSRLQNFRPRRADVAFFGMRLSDTKPQGIAAVKRSVREIEATALIERRQQAAIEFVAGHMAKAN